MSYWLFFMKIYTSNSKKAEEFRRFGLEEVQVLSGPDLKEVQGSSEQVIQYKARDAARATGETDFVIEDTILAVPSEQGNLEEVADIRWRIPELAKIPDARVLFKTSLGHVKDGTIHVFVGETWCRIVVPEVVPEDAFGFDPYLVPEGQDLSFYELNKIGRKDEFSPRRQAVEHLVGNKSVFSVEIKNLPEWEGEFQHTGNEGETRRVGEVRR